MKYLTKLKEYCSKIATPDNILKVAVFAILMLIIVCC